MTITPLDLFFFIVVFVLAVLAVAFVILLIVGAYRGLRNGR